MSQRQEFHIDDEKIFPESGQAALIGRQSCCVVLAIVYEQHTEDMATKVKCKDNDLLQNSQYSRKIFFFRRSI